jgi:hypothetical protein
VRATSKRNPCYLTKIPRSSKFFPVNSQRELAKKALWHSGLLFHKYLRVPQTREIPCQQGISLETGAISTGSPARPFRGRRCPPQRFRSRPCAEGRSASSRTDNDFDKACPSRSDCRYEFHHAPDADDGNRRLPPKTTRQTKAQRPSCHLDDPKVIRPEITIHLAGFDADHGPVHP